MLPQAASIARARMSPTLGLVMMDRKQQGRPPGLPRAFALWLVTRPTAVCHRDSHLHQLRQHHSTPGVKSQMAHSDAGAAAQLCLEGLEP